MLGVDRRAQAILRGSGAQAVSKRSKKKIRAVRHMSASPMSENNAPERAQTRTNQLSSKSHLLKDFLQSKELFAAVRGLAAPCGIDRSGRGRYLSQDGVYQPVVDIPQRPLQ